MIQNYTLYIIYNFLYTRKLILPIYTLRHIPNTRNRPTPQERLSPNTINFSDQGNYDNVRKNNIWSCQFDHYQYQRFSKYLNANG